MNHAALAALAFEATNGTISLETLQAQLRMLLPEVVGTPESSAAQARLHVLTSQTLQQRVENFVMYKEEPGGTH